MSCVDVTGSFVGSGSCNTASVTVRQLIACLEHMTCEDGMDLADGDDSRENDCRLADLCGGLFMSRRSTWGSARTSGEASTRRP